MATLLMAICCAHPQSSSSSTPPMVLARGVCYVARSRTALKRRIISIAVMRSVISSPPTLAGCLVQPLRLDLDELLC